MKSIDIAKFLVEYLLKEAMQDAVGECLKAHPDIDSATLGDAIMLARTQIMTGGVL